MSRWEVTVQKQVRKWVRNVVRGDHIGPWENSGKSWKVTVYADSSEMAAEAALRGTPDVTMAGPTGEVSFVATPHEIKSNPKAPPTNLQKRAEEARGREWIKALSSYEKNELMDQFVLGSFDWMDWDNWLDGPPTRAFLHGAGRALELWEQSQ